MSGATVELGTRRFRSEWSPIHFIRSGKRLLSMLRSSGNTYQVEGKIYLGKCAEALSIGVDEPKDPDSSRRTVTESLMMSLITAACDASAPKKELPSREVINGLVGG